MSKAVNWQTESGFRDENISCNYLTYVPPQKYTWLSEFDMNPINVASAQSAESAQNLGNLVTTDNLLSVPLYMAIFVFMFFTLTMSLIYLYHWLKFNLKDPFIKNFSIIYFIGLCLLLVPLIFNLIV